MFGLGLQGLTRGTIVTLLCKADHLVLGELVGSRAGILGNLGRVHANLEALCVSRKFRSVQRYVGRVVSDLGAGGVYAVLRYPNGFIRYRDLAHMLGVQLESPGMTLHALGKIVLHRRIGDTGTLQRDTPGIRRNRLDPIVVVRGQRVQCV